MHHAMMVCVHEYMCMVQGEKLHIFVPYIIYREVSVPTAFPQGNRLPYTPERRLDRSPVGMDRS